MTDSGFRLRGRREPNELGPHAMTPVATTANDLSRTGSSARPLATEFLAVACRWLAAGWLAAAGVMRADADDAVRLPVTRDTRVSTVSGEELANLGGAGRLRFKSYQEFCLIDVDTRELRGWTIERATLHLRSLDALPLRRITVGTVSAEWFEGTNASGYRAQAGASSFLWRKDADVPWAQPGSDLCAVILGSGNSLWRTVDAFPPDRDGWQRVAVERQVVAARLAGLAGGLVVFDDTGSEWTRRGEQYEHLLMPARNAFSRDDRPDNRPYLTVVRGMADARPPAAINAVQVDDRASAALPPGEFVVTWRSPADEGPAGTLGFHVQLDGRELPRYLIPLAGRPNDTARMLVRDLDLKPGQRVKLTIQAIDAAGNVGTTSSFNLTVPTPAPAVRWAASTVPTSTAESTASAAKFFWLHPLDKVDVRTGRVIEPGSPESPARTINDVALAKLDLAAARNEWVAAQLVVTAPYSGAPPRLVPAADGRGAVPNREATPIPQVRWSKVVAVRAGQRAIPDAAIPVRDRLELLTSAEREQGAKYGVALLEWFVPPDFPPGRSAWTIEWGDGAERVAVPLQLEVWPFALPDQLSFLPEMNCYGLPDDNPAAWYRLAHEHRTCLNRLPYHHNGRVSDGCAPRWNGKTFDWTDWDRRFGPLFDGSAFAGLPRGGAPVDVFYLPLFENWPTPIEAHYNGDYWADRALSREYRDSLVTASREIARHVHERGWSGTLFQFYLNGKNEYKRNGWSRSTSPWTLDEPANFQDFWALRWYGEAFHEGINQTSGPAHLGFRVDISRPQWQRELLDGLVDYNVVSGVVRRYPRIVLDRAAQTGEWVVEYGAANAVDASNLQSAAWCVDAWLIGLSGVLPWQTLGRAESWTEADPYSILYVPEPRGASDGLPVASLRLKSFRYGQQLVEYLELLARRDATPRWRIREAIADLVPLSGRREGTGFRGGEDAGRIVYGQLRSGQLEQLRRQIAVTLAATATPIKSPPSAPESSAAARPWPPRRTTPLPSLMVSRGEFPEWTPRPYDRVGTTTSTTTSSGAKPAGKPAGQPAGKPSGEPRGKPSRVVVLQGAEVVDDAMLDPEQPERAFGKEPRGNALRRAEQGNALLVRFRLDGVKNEERELSRAVLSVRVWDPSSRGRTRVDVAPLRQTWDEVSATWRRAGDGMPWKSGPSFTAGRDTGDPAATVNVAPDQGGDTADPPVIVSWDITSLVAEWLAGRQPNHGVALLPIVDRAVDEGNFTRFQVYGSEYRQPEHGPSLTLEWR